MNHLPFLMGGTEYITRCILTAVQCGEKSAAVTGNWVIDQPVRLPSDFALILENCHLRMADGCYANMFVNEHHDTASGRTLAGRDRNISLIGRGEAILDGGAYNGLSERNQQKGGMPPIWKNNLLLFTNVEGFTVEGLTCINQRWWALNFIYCANGRIANMAFRSNPTAYNEAGEPYFCFARDKYEEVLVKNSDGIDLRQGCHDIVIENITGFTEDDTVALTGLNGKMEQAFAVPGLPSDICNVQIKNVSSAAYCTNVRLLNQGGIKLHDILVDGVQDTSAECPYLDRGIYGVRVGDRHFYGSRHSSEEETYNITIRNVRSRGLYALCLAGSVKNLYTENIEAFDGAQLIDDARGGSR